MTASYVIAAKLRPPRVRDGLIERPDLVKRLRDGRDRALTLVCAPAGYGKTTLLAQWQALDQDAAPFVWVAIDERDSDPIRLWGHLVAALVDGVDRERADLSVPRTIPSITDVVLPRLVSMLDGLGALVLVLDDWHLVRNPICDSTIRALIEQAPDHVQIVVSSRSEPGLPIARLRAHADLVEIRATDLRVSASAASNLFRNAGITLSQRDVERITDRTEGWLGALVLAIVAMRAEAHPHRFVRDFSGDTRHVFDYLAADVLESTDPDTREFLVCSSVLDRLSPSLCDAVLERADSAAKLTEIERSNLFVVHLDASGDEYRYHHLFEAVLRRELARKDPATVRELHVRASRWHEEHGDVEHAVDHAIASGDLERSSALVTVATVPFLSLGRMLTLNRWFEQLSWPEAQADRQLAVVRALTAGLSGGGRDEIERWLRVAERGPEVGPMANGISSIGAGVAMVSSIYLSRGIERAIEDARLVLETKPEESEWRYAALVPLGQALYLAGRREEARIPLDEARRLPGARQRIATALAISYLSLIAIADGDVSGARNLADQAMAIALDLGHGSSAGAAAPHLALGCVETQGTDLKRALEHLERSAHLAGDDAPSYWRAHALLHLAAARRRLGDDEGARDALSRAKA